MKVQHAIEKRLEAKKRAQGVVFKDDLEDIYDEEEDDGSDVDGEDSEERYLNRATKAELRKRRELEENGGEEGLFDGSYDSEGEDELFGRPKKQKGEKKVEDAGKAKKEDKEENGEQKEEPKSEAEAVPKEPKSRKGVQVLDLNDFTEPLEDVNAALKKARLYKPADGVQYREYDYLGFGGDEPAKTAGDGKQKDAKGGRSAEEDWRQYVAKEGDDAGFEFIAAPEESLKIAREILAKKAAFKGGRKDVDIKEEDMNPEEHAVFEVLDGSDVGAEDEIDDDFIAMLNDGKPALVLVDDDQKDK